MKTVGIIAEFNPFHNGHKYIIKKAREITKADNVIVLCSGNYVQRGTPALINKYERARMALQNGVDAVFELPVFYATASAELFARAAISFFEQLHSVDYLCFGCEAEEFQKLPVIAKLLNEEPRDYQMYLNQALESGISFPKARHQALIKYCTKENILDEFSINSLLSKPNNILAIEYLKALKHFNSNIQPVAIKRQGEDYHSLDANGTFASATAIRKEIQNNQFDEIKRHIPSNCHHALEFADKVYFQDFDLILGERLMRYHDFSNIFGINLELSNRISKSKSQYINIETYLKDLHSKNYTHSAISRALLHLCLELKDIEIQEFVEKGYHSYARLLGFNRNCRILAEIKEKSTLPIISKLSTFYNHCDGLPKKMLDICMNCDYIYRMIIMNKTVKFIPTEFESQIVIQ